MKNKNGNNIFVYIILIILFIFLSIIIYNIVEEGKPKTQSSNKDDTEASLDEDVILPSSKPFEEEKNIKITINNIDYEMRLENNITAYDLVSVLPLELTMSDLNNNEKYAYLSFSLNDDDYYYTGKITKGDVMLYQTNCIVIFYKDINTTNSYIKIGHINNLPSFNGEQVKVIIK